MCKLDSGLNRELMKRSQYGAKKALSHSNPCFDGVDGAVSS